MKLPRITVITTTAHMQISVSILNPKDILSSINQVRQISVRSLTRNITHVSVKSGCFRRLSMHNVCYKLLFTDGRLPVERLGLAS
jgi:hypothetical protein